ncbi:MAG TPA: hypothetical protein VLI05_06850 [Candidatus Saccharimonadia bacterium]|nr:hypothetical protein [Candidatus Saccharimonadia bacterium]
MTTETEAVPGLVQAHLQLLMAIREILVDQVGGESISVMWRPPGLPLTPAEILVQSLDSAPRSLLMEPCTAAELDRWPVITQQQRTLLHRVQQQLDCPAGQAVCLRLVLAELDLNNDEEVLVQTPHPDRRALVLRPRRPDQLVSNDVLLCTQLQDLELVAQRRALFMGSRPCTTTHLTGENGKTICGTVYGDEPGSDPD